MTVLPVPVAETSRLRWWPCRRKFDQFQQSRLERFGADFDWAQVDPWAVGSDLGELAKLLGIELPEVIVLPVAFEDGGEFVDDVWVARSGHPDIPLQPRDLGGVGEV